jgi:lipoprotein-anchoring transpeptidase ErfK/SrfK
MPAFLAAAAAALVLLVPAARADATAVIWTSPTPADQTRFSVSPGKEITFTLTAASDEPGGAVQIAPARRLPSGVHFNTSDGSIARGTFSWKPDRPGDHTLAFTASLIGTTTTAPTLTYFVHVKGKVVNYPLKSTLTDDRVARWSPVLRKAVVRAQPRHTARKVTTLRTRTTDSGTQEIVLVLGRIDVGPMETWYRVRLPILPNNSTGWVEAGNLGHLFNVNTHVYVDREHFRLTLKRSGKIVFSTYVGVGRGIWPTPRGEFYIRSKLTSFNDPFYGPLAFGTSARSETLTDWPGGGFVGIHGTNTPAILPGRVSHGCVRVPNANILKLARLMPVGTPLTIT